MQIAGHEVGVCSWSLRPRGVRELVAAAGELQLRHVQLALEPILERDAGQRREELAVLRGADLVVTAGMISFPGEDYSSIAAIRASGGFVPDALWPSRRALAREAAAIAAGMGVTSVSTHVGFIPGKEDPRRRGVILQRVREAAEDFAELGVDLLMETGQESAEELLLFLEELETPNVYVNFDPANMILYGAGDPIAAIELLKSRIRHVHAKDAIPSSRPGAEWGEEVPVGAGGVGVRAFLSALRRIGYSGPLVIEREAGDRRFEDVQTAIAALRAAAPR